MKPRPLRVFSALLLAQLGCGDPVLPQEGHVMVHVDTDAPLRRSTSATGPDALFDRLRVDVVNASGELACPVCARDFDVTLEQLQAAGLSFTIRTQARGLRAHVILYSSTRTRGGSPEPSATIDRTVALPDAPVEGAADASIFLATQDVGRPRGTADAPETADRWSGRPTRGERWRFDEPVPCSQPRPGEAVCVPGGAFWMGSPLVEPVPNVADGRASRIVVLAPFYLDAHELTVAEARTLAFVPRAGWDGTSDGSTSDSYCTFSFGGPDPVRDKLPLNCIRWAEAARLCRLRGGDLPTEAQLEYAASGLRGAPFVWGRDAPTCSERGLDTVISRASGVFGSGDRSCVFSPLEGIGALPPGSGARDRLRLGDGDIVDLAGNLREWTRDVWQLESESCWGPGVFFDPVCTTPSATSGPQARRSARGGTWLEPAVAALAASRAFGPEEAPNPAAGVRCAYPGR